MSKQRIFNSAQEIEGVFGVKVVLRDNLPKNCNVVMYQLGDKPEIRPVDYFVENENGLFYITYNGKMEVQNDSLEDEVAWDYENLGHKTFIYLRLATKDNSDVFTPERLIGVETDKGFITNVVEIGFYDIMKPSYYVYTTESLSKEDLYDVHSLKYYISDDSDETVSFDEYVKLFYDIEGVLWKTV